MIDTNNLVITATLFDSPALSRYRVKSREAGSSYIMTEVRNFDANPADTALFKQELNQIMSITDPGIIPIRDYHLTDTTIRFFSDDYSDITLEEYMKERILSSGDFLNIAIQIAETAARLHKNWVVHKNLSSRTIMINPETKIIRFTCFGFIHRILKPLNDIHNVSVTREILPYISPEQTERLNRSIDYRSDLYSIGIVLYELLTGAPPFTSEDPLEIIHFHIARIPRAPSELLSSVDPMISGIVMKLLEKSAEHRYQNGYGLLHDLRQCQHSLSKNGLIRSFILGTNDTSLTFIIPHMVIGREREIKFILSSFERVCRGANEMLIVKGEPGIGKSAIVSEIQKPVVEKRALFLYGKHEQFRRNVPYMAIIQACTTLVKHLLSESSETLENLRAHIIMALGQNAKVITNIIPELELIIGKQPDVPELPPEESQNRFTMLFKNFVSLFMKPEHPVVLFIDDLQWADSATLKLLADIITDIDIRFFFLIGAYRDSEVTSSHPLLPALDTISRSGVPVNTISLDPLNGGNVNSLISHFLHSDETRTRTLGALIHRKTNGNPFFVLQFLQSLYEENLLELDTERGWIWDIDRIREKQATDNVGDLMSAKLSRLSPEMLSVLETGACIGDRFSLDMITSFHERPIDETLTLLNTAVDEGLILMYGNGYTFQHDNILEALYSRIPDERKQYLHYMIGQYVLEHSDVNSIDDKIQYITDNLNIGMNLFHDHSGPYRLAELNLMACNKAKSTAAFDAALHYANTGVNLLLETSWNERYTLTYDLFMCLAESLHLNGKFLESENIFNKIILHADSIDEKASVYSKKSRLFFSMGKHTSAVNEAILGLSLYDISIPLSPGKFHIFSELLKARWKSRKLSADDLIHLPELKDKRTLMVLQLLSDICESTYFVDQKLLAFASLKVFNISLENGNSAFSPFSYILYAAILIMQFGNYEKGIEIGNIALQLNNIFHAPRFFYKVLSVHGLFLNRWKNHCKTDLDFLYSSFQYAREAGDFSWASYVASWIVWTKIVTGEKATVFLKECNRLLVFLEKYRTGNEYIVYPTIGRLLNLQGSSDDVFDLSFGNFHESVFRKITNKTLLFSFYLQKLQQFYLFEKYNEAMDISKRMRGIMSGASGIAILQEYYFYTALTITALYRTVGPGRRKQFRAVLKNIQKKFVSWNTVNPINFDHKLSLINAEIEQISGNESDAVEFYHKAIQQSYDEKYQFNEALSNELAGKYFHRKGYYQISQSFIHRARLLYRTLGITAKVSHLESSYYPILQHTENDIESGKPHITLPSESTIPLQSVDFISVLKAARALSGEIVLENLLITMMKIAIENAGAQKGVLLFNENGHFTIEALGDVDTTGITVFQSTPLERFNEIPKSLIHYVSRTKESIILGNAYLDSMFRDDPYIQKQNARSILCIPLVRQSELTGIIYLENNLTNFAFPPERIELMNLIASQAAISLENAILFEKARNAEQRLQRQYEEIQSQYEEMEAINEELENTSRDLEQANEELTIFKKFVENSGQGFAMADFDKKITYVNPSLCRMVNIDSVDHMIGANALDYYPDDEKGKTVLKVINTVLHEEQWTGELLVLTNDGSVIPTIQNVFLIRDNAGKPQFFATIVTDIADRKKAETELKNTRNYLNSVFNSISSLLIAVNRTGEIMQFNTAAEQYTGIPAQKALSEPFHEIVPFLKEFTKQIETVIETQSPLRLAREAVLLDRKKYLNISISPLLFKGENGAVIQIDDVTSTVLIEQMMVQTEKMLSIGGLAAGMAHEINNPLGGIMMSAQNIMRRISPDLPNNIAAAQETGINLEKLHDYFRAREIDTMLQGIRNMCTRASQIVKNMLDFSRQSNVVKERADIQFLVEQALELATHDYDLKKKYDFRNIKIIRKFEENLPGVQCIPTEIEQVILNLLKNATQAMWEVRKEGYAPVITIRLYHRETVVFIEIEDNGPGIDEDKKRRVFEPFFTTKEVGVGTGLGLSVSYNIITNNHRGTISVESAPGEGARFIISLPAET